MRFFYIVELRGWHSAFLLAKYSQFIYITRSINLALLLHSHFSLFDNIVFSYFLVVCRKDTKVTQMITSNSYFLG